MRERTVAKKYNSFAVRNSVLLTKPPTLAPCTAVKAIISPAPISPPLRAGDVMTKLRRRRRLSPFPHFPTSPNTRRCYLRFFLGGGKERAPRGGLNWAYSGIPPHLLSLEGKEPAEMKREVFFIGVGDSQLDERGTTYKPRFSSRIKSPPPLFPTQVLR